MVVARIFAPSSLSASRRRTTSRVRRVRMPVMFVDTFNQPNSRDIEPMKGGHGDNYYYQMVSNIRRYKGVRKPPAASAPATIRLDGSFRQWDSVRPEFRDDIGDAAR